MTLSNQFDNCSEKNSAPKARLAKRARSEVDDSNELRLIHDDMQEDEPLVRAVDLTADSDYDSDDYSDDYSDDCNDDYSDNYRNDDAHRERGLAPGSVERLAERVDEIHISGKQGDKCLDFAVNEFGLEVRPGESVELEDGSFMRIKHVFCLKCSSKAFIWGILLYRNRNIHKYFKKDLNELSAILQSADDIENPPVDSSLIDKPLNAIIQKRKIIFTNLGFPRLTFRENEKLYYQGQEQVIEETEVMVCRSKYIEYASVRSGKTNSAAIIYLRESEADVECATTDTEKRKLWREESRPIDLTDESDVSHRTKKRRAVTDIVDLENVDPEEKLYEQFSTTKHSFQYCHSDSPPESYKYGDICAGAGGAARGAALAGLQVSFLLDHWRAACQTLRANWNSPNVKILEQDIFDFCASRLFYLVDVLHVSFPCQVYALCKTVPGRNDSKNEAAGYAIGPILKRTRPRVVTLEQTPGLLLKEKHRPSFAALIHQLVAARYNVRWNILPCDQFGNCQKRKRLFIIASCPGEPLPAFPKPTHGTTLGLKPPVTIADRLRLLSRTIPQEHMRYLVNGNQSGRPFDANRPLKSCITTSGGDSTRHPDGTRSYNISELAVLAGFPPEHKFAHACAGDVKRQIGNAVPSMVARAIFENIVQSMRREDELDDDLPSGPGDGSSADSPLVLDD